MLVIENASFATLVVFAAIALLGYTFGIAVYRLYFHPYAKYPGPFLARTSYLYAFYQARRGDTPITQLYLFEKYGSVVRYNPDSLIFNTPESVRAIYGPGKNFIKGKAYTPMNSQPEVPNLAFTPHKAEHARRRRIIAPGFSDRAAKEQQEYIKAHINTFCDLILAGDADAAADGWMAPINVTTPLSWLGIDITTDLVFGESLGLLHSPDFRFVPGAVDRALHRNGMVMQVPWLFRPGIGKWLDYSTWFMPASVGDIMRTAEVATRNAMKRYQEDPPKQEQERKDILSYLIKGQDPETGTQLTPQDVAAESILLLLAGGDTLATLMSILLFYVSRYPAAHAKLQAEVRREFASAADVQLGERMQRCVYLQGFVKEALRLGYGPAFFRDAGKGGAWIKGGGGGGGGGDDDDDVFIPEGLAAGTSLCGLELNGDIYREPRTCVPERWIVGATTPWGTVTSAADVRAAQAALPAFLYGPRQCVARTLAPEIVHLMLATLVVRADLQKAGETGGGRKGMGWGREDEDLYQLWGNFTVKGKGPVLQFKARPVGH